MPGCPMVAFAPLDGVIHTALMGAATAPLRGLAPVLDRVRQFKVIPAS